MKKILLYITLGLSLTLLVLIMLTMKDKHIGKILTVSTEHLYLFDEEGTMRFMFFINQDHPITSKNSIDLLYLHNDEETEKIPLNVIDIKKSHEERYLNERYMAYEVLTDMPYMGSDYDIKDAYLTIRLVSEDAYTLYIGFVSILHHETETSHITWDNLYGLKKEGQNLSRLHQIDLHYSELSENIDNVEIGSLSDVTFVVEDERVKIDISEAPFLLYHCPIKIMYSNGDIEYIDGFTYFKDYEILKESGLIIHHGTLN